MGLRWARKKSWEHRRARQEGRSGYRHVGGKIEAVADRDIWRGHVIFRGFTTNAKSIPNKLQVTPILPQLIDYLPRRASFTPILADQELPQRTRILKVVMRNVYKIP